MLINNISEGMLDAAGNTNSTKLLAVDEYKKLGTGRLVD